MDAGCMLLLLPTFFLVILIIYCYRLFGFGGGGKAVERKVDKMFGVMTNDVEKESSCF